MLVQPRLFAQQLCAPRVPAPDENGPPTGRLVRQQKPGGRPPRLSVPVSFNAIILLRAAASGTRAMAALRVHARAAKARDLRMERLDQPRRVAVFKVRRLR